jgi:hypothetical protein
MLFNILEKKGTPCGCRRPWILNEAAYLFCVVTRDDGGRVPGDFCPYFITQWSNERGQTDKQWSTKDTHKTKDRIMSDPNTIFTGSLQWLVYIDLTVYQCMRKINLNLFYDFSNLVYFWIGISWLIEPTAATFKEALATILTKKFWKLVNSFKMMK